MKHLSGSGTKLFRCVTVRIFNIGNDGKTTRTFKAQPGHGFSETGVDDLLERIAADLEKRFPREEFGLVQVGPASFHFVWRNTRPAPTAQEQMPAPDTP
jgi:hypothetical protein